MRLTRCDEEGVPKLVQSIAYHPYPQLVEVVLCTGNTLTLCPEYFLSTLGIDPRPLTDEEWADLNTMVEDHVTRYWGDLRKKQLRVIR